MLLVVLTGVDSQAGHDALGEPLKGRKMLVNEMLIRYLKGTKFDRQLTDLSLDHGVTATLQVVSII